jgi:hypothetical protein
LGGGGRRWSSTKPAFNDHTIAFIMRPRARPPTHAHTPCFTPHSFTLHSSTTRLFLRAETCEAKARKVTCKWPLLLLPVPHAHTRTRASHTHNVSCLAFLNHTALSTPSASTQREKLAVVARVRDGLVCPPRTPSHPPHVHPLITSPTPLPPLWQAVKMPADTRVQYRRRLAYNTTSNTRRM